MDGEDECHLTLANLPYDIVRKIIRTEEVSMGGMALVSAVYHANILNFFKISRTWNALVAEYLHERERYPELERCEIIASYNNLFIYISSTVSQCFQNWTNKWDKRRCTIKDGVGHFL